MPKRDASAATRVDVRPRVKLKSLKN
jgi:hypothetical protein